MMSKIFFNICGSGNNESGRGSYKDIFKLLENLCVSLAGSYVDHREILRHVTQYISNCPTALGSTLPYDETFLLTKICYKLDVSKGRSTTLNALPTKAHSAAAIIDSGSSTEETHEITSNSELFSKFHQQLKASLPDEHQRTALLTFLYFMADSRHQSENEAKSGSGSSHQVANSALYSIRSHLLNKTAGDHCSRYSTFPSTMRAKHDVNFKQMFFDRTESFRHTESLKSHEYNTLNDDLVQNIIYAFTGVQGKYLKKDVISGRFKLDSKAKTLNVVQAGMLLRLSELGYYHDLVQSYTDTKNGLSPLGLMGQGFVSALKNELTRYYGMVATLQEQLNRQRVLEENNIIKGNSIAPLRHERLTLMKILVWSVDPLYRLKWLATIAEACREKKGGALASTVHSFLNNGSPMVTFLVRELLLSICGPLYQMLSHWLLKGEINDTNGEFFIECLTEIGPDRLWLDKYRVCTAMLPNFVSTEMAHKILVTGKSINFLCEICEDKRPVKGRDELRQCIEENADHIFSRIADTKLHSTIDAIYLITSKRVLDIVMGPHKLLEHLQAMRRFLLLGQGDFIGILMENLKCELDKPAKELYSYDLSSIMDAAIRSTNAQYDDPEILNHLDVRILTPCDGDIGWDILSLQYTVRGPLATMLEPCMGIYQMLFKPLWRMKHMEFVLSSKIWKDQKCNAKPLRSMASELNPVLYRLHLLTAEMIHFIHQMQYYILFEVIECSWAEFQDRVQQAKALDDILNAHDNFLNAIKCGAFLDSNSGQLCQNMENVYDGIIRLELWQDKFYEICFKELLGRRKYANYISMSEQSGEFGVTAEHQLERDQALKIFEQFIGSYHKSLDNICGDYEKAVRCFLLTLNSHNDHNLQLFGIRLDFNEYYKKRDQRLCVPLTFEHMRMSAMFNGNKSLSGSRYSTIN